ncbi:LuxR C-terminal-related transcriptional regulator [Calidifontibacter terrae]
MSAQPLRLALVNDYQIVVAGLRSMLLPFADRVQVVELNADTLPASPVDVAVYDTFASAADDTQRLDELVGAHNARRVAVYSFCEEQRAVSDALRRGASGYISKSVAPARLVRALERIAAGERVIEVALSHPVIITGGNAWPGQSHGLTAREAEIVGLIARGLSNEEIAARCYLSINTVKTYIRTAYRKAAVSTRAQAVGWALRNGFDTDHVRVN